MIITKEQLRELNKKGETEVRVITCCKEFWEKIEVEE